MIRAQNRTRTCTSLLTLVPETSASTIPPPGQEHESKKCYVSGKRDSNSRPQPWQGCALPTELFPQTMICFMHFKSDSYRIQTYNLLIRSQMLYSVELRSRYFCFASAKVQHFLKVPKLFLVFLQKTQENDHFASNKRLFKPISIEFGRITLP